MLTDTGFLLALLDARDQYHQHANETMAELRQEQAGTAIRFIITWPVWAELDHFLRQRQIGNGQDWFIEQIRVGAVELHQPEPAEVQRMLELLNRYHSSLADLSLIAAAETLGYKRVLAFDKDFLIYRKADGGILLPKPGPI